MQSDPFVGKTLDNRYHIEARVGAGGMGAVYKARHLLMEQAVAIKVLHTDGQSDAILVKRFIREARSSFQIDHRNCVRVTDFGALPEGTLYMVMEFLDGRTIDAEIFADGAMSSDRVRHAGAQIADALAHAHELGLVHRDLKPANIMLLHRGGDYDFVKVFDFGLAKLFDDGAMLTGLSLSPLTQSGIIFGTPEYMSPEQALGGELTAKSDVYTLGVCCYEMLTGCLPFTGAAFTEILRQHVVEKPQRPSEKRQDLVIDPELEQLVMRCLAKEAAQRPTATELATLLRSTGGSLPARTDLGAGAIASSETLVLSPSEIGNAALPGEDRVHAMSSPRHPTPLPPATERARAPSRKLAILAGATVLLGAAVASLALRGGKARPEASAMAAAPTADAGSAVETSRPPVDAARPDQDAGSLAIAQADSGTRGAPRPRSPATAPRSNPHLQAAEDAFKRGNLLKQLAEANAALGDMPRSRRAAYLVGDALEKSGDKVRACAFFKRSSRKHYRAKGCGD